MSASTYEQQLQANVYKLFGIKASKWFMLFMPVVVLFFMDNGLTVGQVMQVQAAYSLAVALFEIPSGYFSDRLGRRLTLTLGMSISALGIGLLCMAHSFWGFIFAEILMGLGGSFISGTDSALLYDSLLQINRKNDYLKLEGRLYSVATFSEAIAAIFGGLIAAKFGMRATLYAFFICLLPGILLSWSLVEPKVQEIQERAGWDNIKRILHYTFFDNKNLRWYVLLSAGMGAATLTMAWFAQPYFNSIGLSTAVIGILWSALNLTVAVFSFSVHYMERFMSKYGMAVLIVVGISLGYAALGFSYGPTGVAFIFLIYIMRGIAVPVLKDFINIETPSDMRATVLSIRGFFIRIIFAVLAPFLGWISDVYTLQQAFLVAAVTFGILGGVSLLALSFLKL